MDKYIYEAGNWAIPSPSGPTPNILLRAQRKVKNWKSYFSELDNLNDYIDVYNLDLVKEYHRWSLELEDVQYNNIHMAISNGHKLSDYIKLRDDTPLITFSEMFDIICKKDL